MRRSRVGPRIVAGNTIRGACDIRDILRKCRSQTHSKKTYLSALCGSKIAYIDILTQAAKAHESVTLKIEDPNKNSKIELGQGIRCQVCNMPGHGELMLLCDTCDSGWHTFCLDPHLDSIPEGSWFCPICSESAIQIQNPDSTATQKRTKAPAVSRHDDGQKDKSWEAPKRPRLEATAKSSAMESLCIHENMLTRPVESSTSPVALSPPPPQLQFDQQLENWRQEIVPDHQNKESSAPSLTGARMQLTAFGSVSSSAERSQAVVKKRVTFAPTLVRVAGRDLCSPSTPVPALVTPGPKTSYQGQPNESDRAESKNSEDTIRPDAPAIEISVSHVCLAVVADEQSNVERLCPGEQPGQHLGTTGDCQVIEALCAAEVKGVSSGSQAQDAQPVSQAEAPRPAKTTFDHLQQPAAEMVTNSCGRTVAEEGEHSIQQLRENSSVVVEGVVQAIEDKILRMRQIYPSLDAGNKDIGKQLVSSIKAFIAPKEVISKQYKEVNEQNSVQACAPKLMQIAPSLGVRQKAAAWEDIVIRQQTRKSEQDTRRTTREGEGSEGLWIPLQKELGHSKGENRETVSMNPAIGVLGKPMDATVECSHIIPEELSTPEEKAREEVNIAAIDMSPYVNSTKRGFGPLAQSAATAITAASVACDDAAAGHLSYAISPNRIYSEGEIPVCDFALKAVPTWAIEENVVEACEKQAKVDPDRLFGSRILACVLEDLFQDKPTAQVLEPRGADSHPGWRRGWQDRGSSSNWLADRITWQEEVAYKSVMGYL